MLTFYWNCKNFKICETKMNNSHKCPHNAHTHNIFFKLLCKSWDFDSELIVFEFFSWFRFWINKKTFVYKNQSICCQSHIYFNRKPELLKGVYAMGFNKPSRIQVIIKHMHTYWWVISINLNWILIARQMLTYTGNGITNATCWSCTKYDCTKPIGYG